MKNLYIRSLYMGDGKWRQTKNVTVRNCKIAGMVHIIGMARNAEGTEYDGINYYKLSARRAGHTERARANAPTDITLDNLTLTRGWFYLAPGVTHVRLTNSRLIGVRERGAIYFDAESAFNVIEGNTFAVTTKPRWNMKFANWLGLPPGIQAISIDGSSYNTITNNQFHVDYDAIHLYRNCGENGIIRHATPSYNTITNNDFRGRHPVIDVGSRYGRGWYPLFRYPCGLDDGYNFGSSKSDEDNAGHNIVRGKRFHSDMSLRQLIKVRYPTNLVSENKIVN